MKYAKVINGVIEKIDDCPRNTENVSNFYLLSDEEKRGHNYYPVQEVIGDVTEVLFIKDESGEYVLSKIKEDLEEKKKLKLMKIDAEASSKIYSVYPEYKQINAALGVYDDITKQELVTFIQSIRDKVHYFREQVNSGNLDIEVQYDTL